MKLSLIVAMDDNQVIGLNNDMPWHLPNDLKYFKTVTSGSPIVMGRKTFESIGRPLPNRHNIIMTRNEQYTQEGCSVVHHWEELPPLVKGEEEVFIIGGSELFKDALNQVDFMYITKIHDSFDGDTYFPTINWDDWTLVSEQLGELDEKNKHDHAFLVYHRVNK
ncbi:dihydrofolate reductase [Alkalibacillus haloalkaliphilus]|uniref:dihydrofolate reductase n=1 Tax=Alkalibacillus haloalkaliphilus TaxID=94136 RepID=UPI0029369CF1|nr:dihydrofolate reductase [Alkalibacillus haloalkaliphilus]MDV2580781.1 dihydrofolate reductase [Alkalibacillus haloalkaliphilus]